MLMKHLLTDSQTFILESGYLDVRVITDDGELPNDEGERKRLELHCREAVWLMGFLDPSLAVHLNEASVCCRLLGLWLWGSAQSSPRGPVPGTG